MLCFIGGPLLRNLDSDGLEVYTDRDTPFFLTTCFGIVGEEEIDKEGIGEEEMGEEEIGEEERRVKQQQHSEREKKIPALNRPACT